MNSLYRPHRSIQVANVTWPLVEQVLKAGATAILPIGSACKQHGEHLPMNTDLIQAEYFAQRLMKDLLVAIWPTVGYGHYPAFINYPGSVSLSEHTFANMVRETADAIISSGASRLAILNTGISTIWPLETATKDLPESQKVTLINVYSGPECTRVTQAIEQQRHGSHADEIETSIMLAIAPQLVQMNKAAATDLEMIRAPLNREDSNQPNYSPSGVYGDARLATAEKGRELVTAILSDLSLLLSVSS